MSTTVNVVDCDLDTLSNVTVESVPTVMCMGTSLDATQQAMQKIIEQQQIEDEAFLLVDLGALHRKQQQFARSLPRVKPFYAVKCNPEPILLQALASLNLAFDCASQAEIQAVLDLGVPPERIIFANPTKPASHIKFARKHGVRRMTFDNEEELHKIKQLHPDAELVLRVLADDSKSVCRLGLKFGTHLGHTRDLLRVAQELELSVVGVSFHVGSGCTAASAFADAVARAHQVFQYAEELGMHLTLLDVGGGFPGSDIKSEVTEGANAVAVSFDDIATQLQLAIDLYFPEESGVEIIAEPGRFYAHSAMSLVVNVTARRTIQPRMANMDVSDSSEEAPLDCKPSFMYYVNDGAYGSFNCILFDHACVQGTPLFGRQDDELFASSVWGPSCDSMDCLERQALLPKLAVGDWLFYPEMGAYTSCAASTFNGFPKPCKFFTYSLNCNSVLQDLPEGFPFRERFSELYGC